MVLQSDVHLGSFASNSDADVQALFAQAGFTLTRAIETRAVTTLRLFEGVPA